MDLQISGTHVSIDSATQQYIESKINKLSKHLPDIIDIKVEVSLEKTRSPQEHFLVRATVNSGVADSIFHGEARGKEINLAVDKLVNVLTRQLEKRKGKIYDKGRGNPTVRGMYDAEENPAATRKVVKTKRFAMEPMTLDMAMDEMENLGHDFFLFLDADDDELRLVYKRQDGQYGVIEPQVGD
jgi:putative sigma-54 modulation protein